ncbi:MAG: hypothetical protein KF819_02445 [Labilithrix sp.]|nr:hypothetical protein [Labilithrix sp.]
MKWRPVESAALLRVACGLGLVGLALMVWSIVDRTVWPVLVALSVGQAVGTLSFLLYLVVVVRDLGVMTRLGRGPK